MRIVKDYNNYVMRNLDRGYSRKDLGVSYVKVLFYFEVNLGYLKLYLYCYLCCFRFIFVFTSVLVHQEKRLRVNMSLRKLHEKVKKQQEKVEEKVCSLVSLIALESF